MRPHLCRPSPTPNFHHFAGALASRHVVRFAARRFPYARFRPVRPRGWGTSSLLPSLVLLLESRQHLLDECSYSGAGHRQRGASNILPSRCVSPARGPSLPFPLLTVTAVINLRF